MSSPPSSHLLTSKKTIIKSAGINFATRALPLLAGILAVPFIIAQLGTERFGLLTLIWAIIGYSTLLDAGLGKALTQHVAAKIGSKETESLPSTILTSLLVSFSMGALGCLILWLSAPALIDLLKVSLDFKTEAIDSFRLMAISLPFLIGSIRSTGVFEAHQRFGFTNLMNLPVVFANFIFPFIILPFEASLSALVLGVLVSRILIFIVFLMRMPHLYAGFFERAPIEIKRLIPLLHYGKWPALNGIVGSLLSSSDRFILSALSGASVVAFLTTPFYALNRFHSFITSSLKVLFPAFGTEFVANPARCRRMYLKTLALMALLMVVPYGILFGCSHLLLSLWITAEFAAKAAPVFSLLALVFYFEGINTVAHNFLDAIGKPKTSTLINFCILPVYLLVMLWMITRYSYVGAAYAYCIKALLEMTLKLVIVEQTHRSRVAQA